MIAAIVVLYYPKRDALDRLLRSVVGQVDRVFVMDNTPGPPEETVAFLRQFEPQVRYMSLGTNQGIAAAQNAGIRASMAAGCSHVLLLDQDSAVPAKMVERFLAVEAALIREGKTVGAIGPQFFDEKTGKTYPAVRLGVLRVRKLYLDVNSREPVEADYLIASGSMIAISVLRQVGLMRDDFFIDWVDVEWGLRARSMGFRSYHVPDVLMTHNVGDAVVTILGRDVHVHNSVRNYYMLRNAIYLFRLKTMGWRWKITFAPRVPCYLFLYPFLADDRLRNVRCVLRALGDGISGHMGEMQQRRAVR
jgi:rhamnosyltransferase